MNTNAAELFSIATIGFKFTGKDGIDYKVVEKKSVRFDDAEMIAYYITVTDGNLTHIIDLDEMLAA